ncbi:pilus assembly protein PilC [Magnetovirga frankeli]|uniref:pilus assembly protein n=1 Tax=Magnetovirga frankeli TaxID=947516 RepID=UPI001AF800C0|nr:pilus assembly protein PilC [gamma proteobacterium SS-5]
MAYASCPEITIETTIERNSSWKKIAREDVPDLESVTSYTGFVDGGFSNSCKVTLLNDADDLLKYRRCAAATVSLTGPAASCAPSSTGDVSQTPLFLGGADVPGNLLLVPSVEWPTVNSVANLGAYNPDNEYTGYFDSYKCYDYSYSSTEADRHFYPSSTTETRTCSGKWSGNFLNWAATQTIDPFRSALTGGHRVKDTSTETWLEKARHDGQGGTGLYPNRRLPESGNGASLVSGATPFNANWLQMRIQGLGNKMRFRLDNSGVDTSVTAYNPSMAISKDKAYEVSIRVKVCVSGMLEGNCKQYSQGYKPEGLLQQNAAKLRYGIFGYLNDSNMKRDGAVLRAQQKMVGPTRKNAQMDVEDNPNQEWDPVTGVSISNPDADDASASSSALGITINNSGVINYLNKFGQLTTNNNKSYDPVGELYYAGLRYLKNQGNVSAYTSMSGASTSDKNKWADGFPVITTWVDPMQHSCQANVMLGIGDIYTHRDKNLPGSSCTSDEPSKPSEVSSDSTVNVVTETNKVGQMEGIGNIGSKCNFTGRNNSAFMAGLAWHAKTSDIRPDLDGTQRVSTYWVDVLEALSLEGMARNQFALAAKYGGFNPPADFDPATWGTDSLPEAWWHTNGETLTPFGSRGNGQASFKRPDNFFLAGEAGAMVQSLKSAFQNIIEETTGNFSAVAASTAELKTDTMVFQARFDSTDWSGELIAYGFDPTAENPFSLKWNAAEQIPEAANRKIVSFNPDTNAGIDFQWSQLNSTQKTQLNDTEELLNYLRGDSSEEVSNGGDYRDRSVLLGDIVNSSPVYVDVNLDYRYTDDLQSGYADFKASLEDTPAMIYVGSNDGMLHAFKATTGEELFAYVPNAVFPNLAELGKSAYNHKYFVDGDIFVGHAYIAARGGWRTVLVGGLGAGGKAIYALDITNPEGFSKTDVLWEFSHADLGYSFGRPTIAPMGNGEWAVILGNGYQSSLGKASLFVLDVADGSLIKQIDLDTSGGNGLSAPVTVANDSRQIIHAFAGDLKGNMWRVDFCSSCDGTNPNFISNQWEPSWSSGGDPAPLFTTPDNRPITSRPAVGKHPDGGYIVFFGTGKFYETGDNIIGSSPAIEAFYGLRDADGPISGVSELLEHSIGWQGTGLDRSLRVTSSTEEEPFLITPTGSEKGWYLPLIYNSVQESERVVAEPVLRNGRIIFVTMVPNPDPCGYGGSGWLMELRATDGSRLTDVVFDLNNDGEFDQEDMIELDGELVPPVGLMPGNGDEPSIPPEVPAIIGDGAKEYKVGSTSSGALYKETESGRGGKEDMVRGSWRQLQ